jgi:uncharacterized membrane protein
MNTTFGIGNVLGTGIRIWVRNFAPFMLITALIYSPVWIWSMSTVRGEMTVEKLFAAARIAQLSGAIALLLNLLVAAALTYGVVMELRGQRASLTACISTGFARFFPALGAALLSILCIIGGLVMLLVGSIVVACMLYVTTPAAVLERPGVRGALRRSRELTAGHKFEIFGLALILILAGFALEKVVQNVTLPHLAEPGYHDETLRNFPTYMYVHLVLQMVLSSIGAVMQGVAYYFLRAEKEGTTADELARIFD